MTVRVANDFQTEAQQNLEQKNNETEEAKERIKLLENENERLKKSAANSRAVESITRTPPSQGRAKYTRSQTVDSKATVKGLIDSIESATKAKTACYTRSSSTPTIVPTLSPIAENPVKTVLINTAAQQQSETETCLNDTRDSTDAPATVTAPSPPVSILSNKNQRATRVF